MFCVVVNQRDNTEVDIQDEVVNAEFVISSGEAGCRVEDYLSPRLPLLSRTKLRVLLSRQGVTCSGRALTTGMRLKEGDRLQLRWNKREVLPLPPEPAELAVLWEDGAMVAVDKPAGMLVHPTLGVKRGTLTGTLLAKWNPWLHEGMLVNHAATPVIWPSFLHRLDKDTSGVVLVAKERDTARAISADFVARTVRKSYLAIVEGKVANDAVRVDAPIARIAEEAPHFGVREDGASAISLLRVLGRVQGRSLVLLNPLTGRTNQLRVHAAHLGHPILGDVSYGAAANERMFLHAWRIAFTHPATGETVVVTAPPPEAFRRQWPEPWPETIPEDSTEIAALR